MGCHGDIVAIIGSICINKCSNVVMVISCDPGG